MSGYTAIIPVKRWENAKRRLDLSSEIRGDLARAFAADVISAVASTVGVDRVVVVSSEPGVVGIVRSTGAWLVDDPLDAEPDRLNAAVLAGAAWATHEHPDAPVIVVPADLPCLTSQALAGLLASANGLAQVVPDAQGDGTALLIGPAPAALAPAFGPGSAARHAARGHEIVAGADPVLRQDVDSMVDLAAAVRLGVGPATHEVLRRHPLDLAG